VETGEPSISVLNEESESFSSIDTVEQGRHCKHKTEDGFDYGKVSCLRSRRTHPIFPKPGRLVASHLYSVQGKTRNEAAPRCHSFVSCPAHNILARSIGPHLLNHCRSAAYIRLGSTRTAVGRPSSSAAQEKGATSA